MKNTLQQSLPFGAPPAAPSAPRNLVIEAGAGTGKTSAIVAEVLRLLLDDETLDPERIVLMTFTEKAAGEIADRIHEALEELELRFDDDQVSWPAGSPKPLLVVPADRKEAWRRACARQIARIDSIRSQTIHSFCQSLLRTYPIEAGLDPQFKIIQGFERSLLYEQAYDAWLDDETRVNPTQTKLQEWEFLLAHVGYLFQIRDLVFALVSGRDLLREDAAGFGSIEEIEEDLGDALTTIRRSDVSRVSDEHALAVFRYVQANEPPKHASLEEWIAYFEPIAIPLREADLPRDPVLKEALVVLRTERSKGTPIYDRLIRHRSAVALLAMTRRFIAFLDEEKQKLGVADFDDLLLRTLTLLENPAVLDRARAQFDYLFVDEFQDTDRTQAKIIEKLATDRSGAWIPGRTVVVGDPKQSIYGFRRADPETYRAMTAAMIESGAEHRPIIGQYRSDRPLLDAINAIFSCVFADASSDANVFRPAYRPLEAGKRELRRESDARITFLHSSVTTATGDDEAGNLEPGKYVREAEALAEWILAHRDGGPRDLQRFAILFRRLTKLDEYLETLDRYGIDYVLPTTRAFLDRRAPVDVLAVLRAIAFPFDRGAEVSAARTPYFALTDDEIGEGILGGSDAWSRFLASLNAYREAAAHLTVSGTIDLLVASTAIEEVYAAITDGVRARRHLEHLRTLAFEYDQKIGGSLRQFVSEIDRRREEPDEMEPSLADDESNAVRILSVHAAKGLEFETVILPDLAFQAAANEGQTIFAVEEPKSLVMSGRAQSISGHFRFAGVQTRVKSISRERDKTEMRRLFYVAVTRAISEVVFVSAADTWKNDGFFSCVAEVFGFDKATFAANWPPEPGRLVVEKAIGTAAIPIAFERMKIRGAGERARAQLLDRELEGALREGALTDLSIAVPPPGDTALSPADAARARAGARQRASGTLLHRFLEQWTGNGDADALFSRLAAEAGMDETSARSVRQRIDSLRRSPSFQRIAAAETIARELPIRILDANGIAVERRIDRLLREGGREVVVDYKTGRPDPRRLENDRAQVARYCAAIEAITARPCEGLLWYIDDDHDELVTVDG